MENELGGSKKNAIMTTDPSHQTLNIGREGKLEYHNKQLNMTQKGGPKVLRFASSEREKLDLVMVKNSKKGRPFEKVARA